MLEYSAPFSLEVNIETLCIETNCDFIESCDRHYSKYDEMIEAAWIYDPQQCSNFVSQQYIDELHRRLNG